jgi:hypothetical protein
MKMRFNALVKDLVASLDVVSVVPPKEPGKEKGDSGYLFVVQEDKCLVYSSDGLRVARAEFPVTEVEDPGSFVYPGDVSAIAPFRFLDQDAEITMEAGYEETGNRHYVKYQVGEAGSEKSTYDPRRFSTFDEALQKASEGFEVVSAVLKTSLQMAKPYVASGLDADSAFATVCLFDDSNEAWAAGNGVVYAADNKGNTAFFFQCSELEGKGLSIHGQHLPFVGAFLAKCGTRARVLLGDSMTYIVNDDDQVFGWSRCQSNHDHFRYPAKKKDQFVLRMSLESVLNALRYVQAGMGSQQSKINLRYSHEGKTLQFRGRAAGSNKVQSVPVAATPVRDEDGEGGGNAGDSESFSLNANVNHLISLVEPAKSHEVCFRVSAAGKKAFFRTIDEFRLDDKGKVVAEVDGTYLCTVTRFATTQV